MGTASGGWGRNARGSGGARFHLYWILDPPEETLAVHRWSADGYVEVLAAQRGERVRAEPFDAVELHLGAS